MFTMAKFNDIMTFRWKKYTMKNDEQRTYIAIDLKSFYASVECVERGLNAVNTNLVVADRSRTEKLFAWL